MAKKKRPNVPASRPAQRAEAAATAALSARSQKREVPAPSDDIEFSDLFKHPLLILAWTSLVVTAFAIWAAFRFRHDLNMGELTEPTHILVWAAITFTLFASYRRQQRRGPKSDS